MSTKRHKHLNRQRSNKPLSALLFFSKEVSIAIILIAIVASLVLVFSAGQKSVYPRYGKVIGVEYDYDCLIIEDQAGLTWEYEGIEDIALDDDIAMLMWNRFTPNDIRDDVILEIR